MKNVLKLSKISIFAGVLSASGILIYLLNMNIKDRLETIQDPFFLLMVAIEVIFVGIMTEPLPKFKKETEEEKLNLKKIGFSFDKNAIVLDGKKMKTDCLRHLILILSFARHLKEVDLKLKDNNIDLFTKDDLKSRENLIKYFTPILSDCDLKLEKSIKKLIADYDNILDNC